MQYTKNVYTQTQFKHINTFIHNNFKPENVQTVIYTNIYIDIYIHTQKYPTHT